MQILFNQISYPTKNQYDARSRLNGPHIDHLANVTANNLRRLELDIENDNLIKGCWKIVANMLGNMIYYKINKS